MVFDPAGLAVGLGIGAALALATGGTPTGPVLINNMPATNVGTEAKGMGHILIPPGVAWVPMPKFPKPSFRGPPEFPGLPVKPEDDAISIMGSTTVTVMGSSAVRLGELWMSCGEPLRMPSSTVITIPKGPPVLIGGPPGVNLLDALLAMVKTKWVAGYLHGLISRVKSTRLRNLLSKAACFLTGHPVDVATGRLLTDNVDFALPGPLPLRFERNYASSWSHRDSALGHGWSHSLDQALWFERGKAVLLAEDGREIEFDLFDLPERALLPGQQIYEPINQLLLRRVRPDLIEVQTQTGEVLEFAELKQAIGTRHRGRWRIQRRRDRQRREISFHYDPRGNLGWVRDAAGRAVTFEYDQQDRLSVVRLPHPSQQGFVDYVRYTYDPEGDLVQVTDALGSSWSFAYERHLMVRETNRNGLSFYFAYDGWGSDAYCVRTWGDGGIYDHVITYAKGSLTVVTNSLGDATAYKLNAAGQVVELLDARGGSTKYEYDERSLKPTKLTRPDGGTIQSEYDAQGNVTRIQEADGTELRLEYNALNQPVRAQDALGGEWRWAYDNAGRILGNQNPAGERTQFHWGERDIAAVTDAAGQHTQLGYDAAGNLTTLTTPDGNVGRFSYDQLGRMSTRTDVAGNVQRRHRDVLGRLVRVEEPDGNVREFVYDREGNVLVARDRHQDVRFEYCGLNRVAARSQANTRVGFKYDTEERLCSITNEHASIYRFIRDGVGDVLEEYGFDGLRRQYVRDVAGRVVEVKRPGARRTRYAYDARSRLLNVKYDDGTSEAFAYRADGALTAAKNDAIELSFERDALGRLLKEAQGQDWVASQYDALGRRVRMDSSKGAFQRIRRDSMGRVLRVDVDVDTEGAGGLPTSQNAETEATFSGSFERDRFGLELERSLPGGIRARWQRDQFGRPVRHEVWRGTQWSPPNNTPGTWIRV